MSLLLLFNHPVKTIVNAYEANAIVLAQLDKSTSASAIIQSSYYDAISFDALLLKQQSGQLSASAFLQSLRTASIDAQAVLLAESLDAFVAAAVIDVERFYKLVAIMSASNIQAQLEQHDLVAMISSSGMNARVAAQNMACLVSATNLSAYIGAPHVVSSVSTDSLDSAIDMNSLFADSQLPSVSASTNPIPLTSMISANKLSSALHWSVAKSSFAADAIIQ